MLFGLFFFTNHTQLGSLWLARPALRFEWQGLWSLLWLRSWRSRLWLGLWRSSLWFTRLEQSLDSIEQRAIDKTNQTNFKSNFKFKANKQTKLMGIAGKVHVANKANCQLTKNKQIKPDSEAESEVLTHGNRSSLSSSSSAAAAAGSSVWAALWSPWPWWSPGWSWWWPPGWSWWWPPGWSWWWSPGWSWCCAPPLPCGSGFLHGKERLRSSLMP